MDKFSAVWLSHSSISDFQKCPRAYYLNNVYKDPRTGHKITLTSPALALGSAVHTVLESLSTLPVKERFTIPLSERFRTVWTKVAGVKGGFTDTASQEAAKARGLEMLTRVTKHPGPLSRLAVKIKADNDLPQYWLSEEDGLILCGKLDWLEYLESEDAVHIIDFKTGAGEERPDSLQLPIYYLLAHNCQERKVAKVSYWYLARDNAPRPQTLPDLDVAEETILKLGREIKLARQLERFKCPAGEGGCKFCTPYEQILAGKARFVGTSDYNQDVYLLTNSDSRTSEIL